MQAFAPYSHSANICFICQQYVFYFDAFCRLNRIEVVKKCVPITASLFARCDGGQILFIDERTPLTVWLPKAYKVCGLPCLNFELTDGQTHLGQFISSN
jgi:hypothetical protein